MINILLLVGKTCSGKNAIQDELKKFGFNPVVTYTTRPMRPGEVAGETYNYITNKEFFNKINEEFFAEYTSYDVVSGETWYYGSPVNELLDDKVMIVNPDGLKNIKKIHSIDPIAFYIIADDEIVWNRLRMRGDDAKEARRRILADNEDFQNIDDYIDFAFKNNGELKPAVIAEMIAYTYRKAKGGKNY